MLIRTFSAYAWPKSSSVEAWPKRPASVTGGPKTAQFGLSAAEATIFGRAPADSAFSAQARPKCLLRRCPGRKAPFRPTPGRRATSFAFFSFYTIVSEIATKNMILLKKIPISGGKSHVVPESSQIFDGLEVPNFMLNMSPVSMK